MERIPSFSKNHDLIKPGLYECGTSHNVTTWDLRFKKPNAGDYIEQKALHTIEHLAATILRNGEHKDDDLAHMEETHVVGGAGKVYDLILPICVLIVLCISGMLYTGGILDGVGIIDAFANCDSSTSLVLGSFFTLIFTFILYIPRKILTFGQFCEAFT